MASMIRWLNDDLERGSRGVIEVLIWSDWKHHEKLGAACISAENPTEHLQKTHYFIWLMSFVISPPIFQWAIRRSMDLPQFIR
jgi:hypothetical protein